METTSVKTNSEVKKKSLKTKVQKFETSLSGIIMSNISSLIAWGLITAIFMASGWCLKKFDSCSAKKSKPVLKCFMTISPAGSWGCC